MRWRGLTRCASKFAKEKIASGFQRGSVAAEAVVVGGPSCLCLYDLDEGVYQITGTSSDIQRYECVPRGRSESSSSSRPDLLRTRESAANAKNNRCS